MCELVFYTNCWKPNACEKTLLNKYSLSEMPLGQSNEGTHIQVEFFSFMLFYFATWCPETQWPHLSLFSCLTWTDNLS